MREYNRLLLDGIANDPRRSTKPSRSITGKVGTNELACTTVTVAYKKMCWKPVPDGDPDEGEREVSDVPQADGASSVERPASEIQPGWARMDASASR